MELPPPTVDAFIEHVVAEKNLRLTEFYPVIVKKDADTIRALGKCAADKPVYSANGSKAVVLFDCNGAYGNHGMAVMLDLKDSLVAKVHILAVNKIAEGAE